MPWDDTVRARFATVEQDWARLRAALARRGAARRWPRCAPRPRPSSTHIDALVDAIEAHMSRWTALQHLLQTAVLTLVVAAGAALLLTGYRFVLEPVSQLKRAIERLQGGDFGARVRAQQQATSSARWPTASTTLAEHLQSMYRNLEAKVAEKTAQLQEKGERLQALYDVSTLITGATTLDELAHGFTQRIARVAHADAVALRWSDEGNQRYLLLASQGLPQGMVEHEQCLAAGDCHCGVPLAAPGVRVIPMQSLPQGNLGHCARADFGTVVSLPIRLHERTDGRAGPVLPRPGRRRRRPNARCSRRWSAHLSAAMENLRLDGLAKEAAVSQERNLLARELHDSIAQSLAFLKIQVQLMRDALASGDAQRVQAVLAEIDTGVRESYGDVRELLLHFRTRTNGEHIEPALQTTLRKFEHQSGIKASLQMHGQGLPLAPDLQIQVLHILQEALSNVRKHARASHVWLDVQQQPHWRFEVRDDGIGFQADDPARSETHVGLRIMAGACRAHRRHARADLHAGARHLGRAGAGRAGAPMRPPAEAQAADVMNARAPIRILVVDDHTLFRRGLTALLARDASFQVVGDAADAGEAQRRAAELQPDLILLDNHLPGVNGVDALPALREAAPAARILMLTVSEDEARPGRRAARRRLRLPAEDHRRRRAGRRPSGARCAATAWWPRR